ncbi:unnamed protein product [Adineta ricciae]|uniref:FBA domain-containing protein n=1 Tax=Adineta ricciae TaxID=249248 RepID=A0A815EYK3_ADIRI|nr:unnamed protein product [Adineta ricciae]
MNYFDKLPDELLEKIFSSFQARLPLERFNHAFREDNAYYFNYSLQQPLLKQTHKDISNLSLVCRRFHQIIHARGFWERKCRDEHVLLPDQHFPEQFAAYEQLYVNNPFHPAYNLLKSDRWTKSNGGQSRIENDPCGSHRLYDEFGRLAPCRVTSYIFTTFRQRRVNLSDAELLLNNSVDLRPVIEFSVCVAARWDCGARCILSLSFSDGHAWRHGRRFPQWNDKKWHRITYRYGEYTQYPSWVDVSIAGSDTQFWAGFYGVKFAQPRLRLLLRTNENQTNEESVVTIEPKEEDELEQAVARETEEDNISVETVDSSSEAEEEEEEEPVGDNSFDDED